MTARCRGNDAALVVFERADHGGGGFNTRAGRDAVLRFLAHRGLLPRGGARQRRGGGDPHAFVEGAKRVFATETPEYPARFRAAFHRARTLRLSPLRG